MAQNYKLALFWQLQKKRKRGNIVREVFRVKSGCVEALYKYNLSKTSSATKFVQWNIFASPDSLGFYFLFFLFLGDCSALLPWDAVTCVCECRGRSERQDQGGQRRWRKALAKANPLIATRRQECKDTLRDVRGKSTTVKWVEKGAWWGRQRRSHGKHKSHTQINSIDSLALFEKRTQRVRPRKEGWSNKRYTQQGLCAVCQLHSFDLTWLPIVSMRWKIF